MQNLNLKQLEIFVTVVDNGSFTAAAEQLYLAQSTVSGHISALETEMGLTLLVRTGKRKLALTDAGQRVYAHAKTILQNCADLHRELTERLSLDLTLAASSVPMQYLLPRYLAQFSRAYPQYRFTLREGDSDTVHKLVLSGQAQLGFVGAVLDQQALQYELLAQDELVLITPDTPEFQALQGIATGNQLLDRPLILRSGGSGTKLAVDRFLCDNQLSKTHIIAQADSAPAIGNLVREGLGVAIVSGFAPRDVTGLLTFPLTGQSTTRPLYLIRPKGCRLTKPAQALYDTILGQQEP